jgi:hypothetical protein
MQLARALLLFLAVLMVGCNSDPQSLSLIAGSEIKDLEPIFADM